jgi:hypothetical protein
MATGNVYVTVVDVGQGQCTFVEVYDTSSTPKLIHTVLVDCGSDKRSTQRAANLQGIVDIVSSMETPAFDCIIFSHSDNDHVSLTRRMLLLFDEGKKPVVKKVWYGGRYALYKKRGTNILDYLVENDYCTADDIKSPGSNFSDYVPKDKNFATNLWQSGDASVKVFCLVANTMNGDPDWSKRDSVLPKEEDEAELKNRVSIVCGVYYAGVSYTICGDATNTTMSAFNQRFEGRSYVFGNNAMTTLPHHGSKVTGYATDDSSISRLKASMVVQGFSSILKSKTITVSAFQKHSHPSLYLMTDFIPTIKTPITRDTRLKQRNAHRVTANIDLNLYTIEEGVAIKKEEDQSFETTTNIFSTNYTTGDKFFSYNIGSLGADKSEGVEIGAIINEFACWRYRTASNGDIAFAGYPNLASPLTAFTSAPLTESNLRSVEVKEINASPDSAPAFEPKPLSELIQIRTTKKQWRKVPSPTLFSHQLEQVTYL